MTTWELVGTIVGSIFGSQALTAIVNSWANRTKMKAEVDTETTDNALKWAGTLTQRIDKLEMLVEALRRENLELHKEVSALRVKVDFYEKGVSPIPPPVPKALP